MVFCKTCPSASSTTKFLRRANWQTENVHSPPSYWTPEAARRFVANKVQPNFPERFAFTSFDRNFLFVPNHLPIDITTVAIEIHFEAYHYYNTIGYDITIPTVILRVSK